MFWWRAQDLVVARYEDRSTAIKEVEERKRDLIVEKWGRLQVLIRAGWVSADDYCLTEEGMRVIS